MFTLAVLILAAPTQLDLIWNISPSPDGTYAACGGNATACVVPGEWWAICRSEAFGAAKKTLTAGQMTLDGGLAKHAACESYQALIAKAVVTGDPTKAAFADPGCETTDGKSTVGLAPFGSKTIAYKSNPDDTVQFGELAGSVFKCEQTAGVTWSAPVAVAWNGPPLPLRRTWSVDVVGDLDNDGAIEVLLSKKSTRSAMDYGAMLATLRNGHLEQRALTVTNPKIPMTAEGKEVQAVRDAYDMCEHWAGEGGDGDPKRNAEVARNVNASCKEFKTELAAARRKYPKNAALSELAKSDLAK